MKFFFRVRNNEAKLEELPEVPLRRSPSISDRKAIQTESISSTTDLTESTHYFVKPKSPKPIVPEMKCEKQSVCDVSNESNKNEIIKCGEEMRKCERSDKVESSKRNSELRKSLGNDRSDKGEKRSAKEDEKNQKIKNVKKLKEDSSEKRVENIKLKIDLSRQNSVTIIKTSVNDLKMKFKTERENKSELSETSADKAKDETSGKKKQEIDVIKLSKVTENSKDNEVKYEIKSSKNTTSSDKSPVLKIESDIKTESEDDKKSEFLESFELTPTKSLSPEKLAILAENKKIENATANQTLSAKKDVPMKNSTKIVPWHKPFGVPADLNSKSLNESLKSKDKKCDVQNVSVQDGTKAVTKEKIPAKKSISPTPSSSSHPTKPLVTILPKQPVGKVTPEERVSSKSSLSLNCSAPNKDNPLKTTITKSASLSPKLPSQKLVDEVTQKASDSRQNQSSNNGSTKEPTTSKRKSKEPIKNISKRRFSLCLEQPTKNSKLPSMPLLFDNTEKSTVIRDVEMKSAKSPNRIWCVDPIALAGKNADNTASNQENNKGINGNAQKRETESTMGKMLPPVSTSTPRKSLDNKIKGKIRLNPLKSLVSMPRKLPNILPKPSPTQASNMPNIAKMLKNPDTEIKQIPNGKDIKVYGPAMDMPVRPLGSSSPAYVPAFNAMHRNPTVGYLNYALMNSRRSNELPLNIRSPAYAPPSPIYSPNSPQYTPNYNIPSQPQFKYMKSPAYVPNYQPMPISNGSQKIATSSPKKNENNKRPHPSIGDGHSPPEKQAKVQSLLESCKINFPSSLSITLHEQNDSSLNNPLFNPKRNSPVNNYIEIVKLPEIPAKEDVKPKSEPTKTAPIKALTPKAPIQKPSSPKPQTAKPSGYADKEKGFTETNNVAPGGASELKKSPETKAIPDLNPMDKNVATLLKVKRDKDTGYQGKFLESILDKKRTEKITSAPKVPKPNADISSVVTGAKKPTTPPLPSKTNDTNATLKSLLKNNDKVSSTKPVSPKSPPSKQNKTDIALDLSASVNLGSKTSINNNNKNPSDQSDVSAVFADVMARASHNPSFMLPGFGQQMGINMQQAILLEHLARVRRAGHDKLNDALESFLKNLKSKSTENS